MRPQILYFPWVPDHDTTSAVWKVFRSAQTSGQSCAVPEATPQARSERFLEKLKKEASQLSKAVMSPYADRKLLLFCLLGVLNTLRFWESANLVELLSRMGLRDQTPGKILGTVSKGLPWAHLTRVVAFLLLGIEHFVYPSWEEHSIGSLHMDSSRVFLTYLFPYKPACISWLCL